MSWVDSTSFLWACAEWWGHGILASLIISSISLVLVSGDLGSAVNSDSPVTVHGEYHSDMSWGVRWVEDALSRDAFHSRREAQNLLILLSTSSSSDP